MANHNAKGENNGRAVMTVDKVKEARATWELFMGRTQPLPGKHNNRVTSIQKMAKYYGVAASTMRALLRRETWGGVR